MSRILICGLTAVFLSGAAVAGELPQAVNELTPAARAQAAEAMLKVAAARWRPAWEHYIANEEADEDRYNFISEPAADFDEQHAFCQRICDLSSPSGKPLLAVIASGDRTSLPHAIFCVQLMCMDEEFPRGRAIELVAPLVDSDDEVVKRTAEETLSVLVDVSDSPRRAIWQKAKRKWTVRWEGQQEAKHRRKAPPSVPVVARRPE